VAEAAPDAARVEVTRLPDDAGVPRPTRVFETSSRRLAVGPSELYVIRSPSDELVRLPKSGGVAVSLEVKDVSSIVLATTGIYYTTSSTVSFLPFEASAPRTLATDQRYPGYLIQDSTRVCWTAQVSSNAALERSILCQLRSDPDSGSNIWFEGKGPSRGVGNISFDGRRIVFVRDKAVYVGDTAGKLPTQLAKVDVDALLGADGDGVYVLATGTYDGTILRLPRNGSAPERLLHVQERVSCAVFAHEAFYVASYHHLPGDLFGHGASIGTLWRHRLGAPAAEPLATGFGSCLDIAVDERDVYFASYDGVYRVPR
jgi:hypothetical protein